MPTVQEVDGMAQNATLLVAAVRREGFSDKTPDSLTAVLSRLDMLRAEIEDFFRAIEPRKAHHAAAPADINGVTLTQEP